MTNKEQWPEGATHKIGNTFTKWANGTEYSFSYGAWTECASSWPLDQYKKRGYEIIERPEESAQYVPEVGEWCERGEKGSGRFYKVFMIGFSFKGFPVFETKPDHDAIVCDSGMYDYRPIKSERDVFIERAMKSGDMKDKMHLPNFIGVLYDNGVRFGDE